MRMTPGWFLLQAGLDSLREVKKGRSAAALDLLVVLLVTGFAHPGWMAGLAGEQG